MYQIYKFKIWFIQTFLCVHDYRSRESGIEHAIFATCKKCGKFTNKI